MRAKAGNVTLRLVNPNKLRWGILSTANIARKNWKAIQLTGNATVVAVASRDRERSTRFIAECQAEAPMESGPRALGDYAALIESPDVDAVYVPLPTGLRKEWVLRAARAGKHIVCEKPCAASLADLREMLEACRSHKVQFMDGVMFMHSRRLDLLRQVLDGGTVGTVRRMASAFAFRAEPAFFAENIRAHSQLEPYGCLGDLGWYCIRFALWERGWQLPIEVSGRRLSEVRRPDSPAPVPTGFCAELVFPHQVSASFYCSFLTETEQWVRLSAERGCLQIADFVLPCVGPEIGFEVHHTDFQVNGCDFRMQVRADRHTVAEHSHGHADAQETNLFRNFSATVLAGTLNPLWPEMALKTQQVMCACLESANAGGQVVPLA